SAGLLPRRRELLAQALSAALQQVRTSSQRRLADSRRQNAEQMFELRGLRGKSGARLRQMLQRIDTETADFEHCSARIAALRAVQMRMLAAALPLLSNSALRAELATMHAASNARAFHLGARAAFSALCGRLRAVLVDVNAQASEMQQMLDASLQQLNAEHGFAFAQTPAPALAAAEAELALIERNYSRYLSLSQLWRLALPGFMDQFQRMLASKLRLVFEGAAGELERWQRAATDGIDQQLRERRRGFKRRRDALERVQVAAGELEQRIAEVEAHDAELEALRHQLNQQVDAALDCARGAGKLVLPGQRQDAA
ncbi:MAG: dynamin family protein, partial [Rubrivivax sp.]|nr:dynamin family protein [Rubrivivax sp.]